MRGQRHDLERPGQRRDVLVVGEANSRFGFRRHGRTIGGHLGAGSIVYTTAEIVVADLKGARFRRELDPATTFKELVIE